MPDVVSLNRAVSMLGRAERLFSLARRMFLISLGLGCLGFASLIASVLGL